MIASLAFVLLIVWCVLFTFCFFTDRDGWALVLLLLLLAGFVTAAPAEADETITAGKWAEANSSFIIKTNEPKAITINGTKGPLAIIHLDTNTVELFGPADEAALIFWSAVLRNNAKCKK